MLNATLTDAEFWRQLETEALEHKLREHLPVRIIEIRVRGGVWHAFTPSGWVPVRELLKTKGVA